MLSPFSEHLRQLDTTAEPVQLVLSNAQEMQACGRELATYLRAGDLVTLSGDLGAGKTTFTQGIGQGLGLETEVNSPTFVLMNEYQLPDAQQAFLHLDAYRLEGLDWNELRDMGLEDLLSRNDAIKLIEWPEMISQWLPRPRFHIEIEILEAGRRLTIRP